MVKINKGFYCTFGEDIEHHTLRIDRGSREQSKPTKDQVAQHKKHTESIEHWSVFRFFCQLFLLISKYFDEYKSRLKSIKTVVFEMSGRIRNGSQIEKTKDFNAVEKEEDIEPSADDSLVILDVVESKRNNVYSFLEETPEPSDDTDGDGGFAEIPQYGTSLRLCDNSKYQQFMTNRNYRPETIPISRRESIATDNVLSEVDLGNSKTSESYDSVIMKHYLPDYPISKLSYSLMDTLLSNFHIDRISDFYKKERDLIQESIDKEKERSQSIIQPLGKNELKQVVDIWRSHSNHSVVSNYQIDITVRDFKTLDDGKWLNDNIIDYYFNLITSSHPEVYGWTTHFFTTLQEKGYSGVARWAKRRKINVTEKKLILVPINIMSTHWALAVVDNINRNIKYYDSLVSGGNHTALEVIKHYMAQEAKRLASNVDYNNFRLFPKADAPQQKNGYDCGVFTCTGAKFIVEGNNLSFGQRDMKTIRRRMAYEILNNKLIA